MCIIILWSDAGKHTEIWWWEEEWLLKKSVFPKKVKNPVIQNV